MPILYLMRTHLLVQLWPIWMSCVENSADQWFINNFVQCSGKQNRSSSEGNCGKIHSKKRSYSSWITVRGRQLVLSMLRFYFRDLKCLLFLTPVHESHTMASPSSPGYLPQYLLGGNSPAASVSSKSVDLSVSFCPIYLIMICKSAVKL